MAYSPVRTTELMTAFAVSFPQHYELAGNLLKIVSSRGTTHLLYPYLEEWITKGQIPEGAELNRIVEIIAKRS
jgi:hypothetical protein